MAIDRILWKNPIKVIDLPNWICPTCKIGFLKGKEKDFNIQSDSHSIKSREHPDWEPYWIKGVFNGALKCNNNKCLETVVLLGEMVVHEEQYYIEEYDDVDYSCVEVLKPKIFFPPLEIFPISESIPLEIKIALLDSFYLFFTDNSSCANKIRIVVELILDKFKIKKTTNNSDGKRKKVALHHRIEQFKVKYSSAAELLMAIKWIGNVGSHSSEALTRDDILDGMEMLEHVVNMLFESESKRIKTLVKTINKRKGPIKNRQ
jgi:hypothetical protein